MLPSEIVNPNITFLYLWEEGGWGWLRGEEASSKHMGFTRAYNFPANLMWTTIGFTEKLSIDFHTKKYGIHYSNSLMVSSCNLNQFDTTV